MGPREGDVGMGDVGDTRGDKTDEAVFRICSIVRGVKEDRREDIEHGGDILIDGLTLNQGESFLRSFERDSDFFGRHGMKIDVVITTIEKLNSKRVY